MEKVVTDWIVSDATKSIEERTKVYYRKSSTEFGGDALLSVEAVIGTIAEIADVSKQGFSGDIDHDTESEDAENETDLSQASKYFSCRISRTIAAEITSEVWKYTNSDGRNVQNH